MQCVQCGATSDEGQRFCYNCGARLGVQNLPPAPTIAPPLPPAPPQHPGSYQPPTAYQPGFIPNSTLAIASVVSGVLSWVILPLIGAIVAVITGHMARNEIRNANGRLAGGGLATIGLILGYAQFVVAIVGGCFLLFLVVLTVVS